MLAFNLTRKEHRPLRISKTLPIKNTEQKHKLFLDDDPDNHLHRSQMRCDDLTAKELTLYKTRSIINKKKDGSYYLLQKRDFTKEMDGDY
jgi:hypothetical protein